MSRPTAISPEEQEQIARRIGVLLLQAAGEDWQQITVEYRATGEYHDLLGEMSHQDGSAEPWEPPEELLGIFEHLREGMYRPDVGTWLSALYVVERPSSYRIDINFDSEPQWRRPLPRAAYVDELRRYPRTDENVPDWLRDRLESSPAPTPSVGESPTAVADMPVEQFAEPVMPDSALDEPNDAPEPDVDEPAAAIDQQGVAGFRTAQLFDDADEQGRPLVTTRTPVHPDEVGALRQYLENAPIVSASRDNEIDQLDPEAPATVPDTWHTDGVWLWQGAVSYYLTQYGVPPQTELLDHIHAQRFVLAEVDDRTRDAAVTELLDQPPTDGPTADPMAAYAEPMNVDATESTYADNLDDSTVDSGYDEYETAVPASSETSEHDVDDELDERGADSLDAVSQDPEPESWNHESDIAPELAFGSRHGRGEDEDEGTTDSEKALAQLHDELTRYEVDSDAYRVGSHNPDVLCLLQDGLDWIVAGPGDTGDIRFSRADQAAAFLLGSLLMSRSAAPLAAAPEPVRAESPSSSFAVASDLEELPTQSEPEQTAAPADLPSRTPAEPEPLPSAAMESVDAPQEPVAPADLPQRNSPDADQADADRADADQADSGGQPASALGDLPRRPTSGRDQSSSNSPGGHFLFTANQDSPADIAATAHPEGGPEAATRFQPAPNLDRLAPGPQTAPPSPPNGQSAPPRPDEYGAPGPSGFAGPNAPLPKRPPHPDAAGSPQPEPGYRPAGQGEPPSGPPQPGPGQVGPGQQGPAQQGPGQVGPGQPGPAQAGPAQAGPAGGAERRPGPTGPAGPGMTGPPRQGPGPQGEPSARPAGGRPPRPPQGGPGEPPRPPQAGQPPQGPPPQGQQPQGANPAGGQEQQIQPLRGEPPLTLFRDRRQVVLQPGTDLDRFGDPSGNVSYAIRTPYRQRSLPPQWSTRPYLAYRVQRPMQVLRGTAVPWFEQPGGGTAYVLPKAVSDLIADGTLIELSGNEAPPRPSMD